MWTASKLSRSCAHHHVLSQLHPRPTRDAAAAKGKLFHAAMEEWHRSGTVRSPSDDDVMTWVENMMDHGWTWPDGAELEKAWGLSKWGTFVPVEETAPDSHVYRAIDGEDLLTAGRSDAVWLVDEFVVSCDFKTGRTMPPPAAINLQVNAAGIAHAQRWKARGYVPVIYMARSGTWDTGPSVEIDTPAWEAMFVEIKNAAALDAEPHPGPHCSDCWERKHCEAA